VTAGLTLEELLSWSEQSSHYWKSHLDANPNLLALPCGIGGAATLQELVRHIWGAELRWSERLSASPETPRDEIPVGPLQALFDLHRRAVAIFRDLLAAPESSWSEPYILKLDVIPPELRTVSRRKIAVHMLIHSQRHWAQIATLVRNAGFPSGFRGDVIFASLS